MTISKQYQNQLVSMHASRPHNKKWGTTGGRNAGLDVVRGLTGRGDVKTVLDFGSGQGTLGKVVTAHLPYLEWHEYDPGIPGKDILPDRTFDFIVSSDVMEHVEPDELDNVVAWQRAHAKRGMLHHIACDPCGLTLPDGRNAHLICEQLPFWETVYVSPEWLLMFAAQCKQLKRGVLKNHCILQLDRR